jgi:protein-L-isoaspartate(D-aspartate) O-methyltransferase
MSQSQDSVRTVEARAALLLQVRRAGVRDIAVMRAIESVPREFFAPYRFKDLAARNMALPIGCGQIMPSTADLAHCFEALEVQRHHRVLEIGAGSGYGAAVLSKLAREVTSIERYQTLAIEAEKRLKQLMVTNASVLFADGLSPPPSLGCFDRIVMHMSVEAPPQAILDALEPRGGVLIFGRVQPARPDARRGERLIRLRREADGSFEETDIGPCRLGAALEGAALAL